MKRQSPMPSGPPKRPRDDSGPAGPSLDPDQLSDALTSAGVDLREEENLLSSSVHATGAGAYNGGAVLTDAAHMFLDAGNLVRSVERATAAEGIRYSPGERQELLGLMSAATAEWVAEIVTQAAMISRHRRMSRNDTPGAMGKALRQIAAQDKDAEQRHDALKLSLGIGGKGDGKGGDSEETQHRAANDTALMMTQGRKRYSWLSGGDSGASRPHTAQRGRTTDASRFKEVREDPGLVLRDLLVALEGKHAGVRRTLVKGYARMRD